MAGLDDLTGQALGSPKSFNWTWFIELVTCGILVVWFTFYFNRLFATIVAAILRAYTWHKFRVYVDIQSLQISLLGGRIFFKGVRYHGENETVYIHSGHLTWRYWLRAARHVDLSDSGLSPKEPRKESHPSSPIDSEDTEPKHGNSEAPASRRQQKYEARVGISVTGLEWFIYNRTPVYDAIIRVANDQDHQAMSPQASRATTAFTKAVENKLRRKSVLKKPPPSETNSSSENETLEKEDTRNSTSSTPYNYSQPADDAQSASTDDVVRESAEVSSAHSLILRSFPLEIDCSRGSISLGNENTKAIIVTTFARARGHIDASSCGPADIYKQEFDFDVEHPVVQMRPNPDYNLPQLAAAEKIISGTDSVLKRRPWWRLTFDLQRRKRKMVQGIRGLFPGSNRSVESFHGSNSGTDANRYMPFTDARPDNHEWHGLDRYMDEDDADDHQAWLSIEYARFSTIVDCPSVHVNFYWDVPGTVQADHLESTDTGLAKDVNGLSQPKYGLYLGVRGGTVNYGPWTDRLRAEIQTIFFPFGYKTATPAERLKPGDFRQSSVMNIHVDVQEEVTLRVPVRESSKDWRWRGRATAVRDAAALRKQQERRHFRFRRGNKRRLGPEIRPFGWFSISVGACSKVRYDMDMVAGFDGYRNLLKLDLLSTKATSSVNHAVLWECEQQSVSCNLSNPLAWNDLHSWRFDLNNKSMDLYLLRDHTFLLLDLITDFTAGQKSDYMTFMPFEYKIGISFTNFNLFLNANDFNIIDNPTDADDNAFLILGFELLTGEVGIPMKSFSPAQNHVSFRGSGKNASLLLKTPLWSTLRTFAENETMATLKTLQLDGVYNYHAGTSPSLTDSLFMNIVGGQPLFHLQGFLIRYFMNVKENYFGDHIHFSTLEEYQSFLNSDTGNNNNLKKSGTKKQNDLDVILSVRADKSSALMPANIYSRTESLRVDVLLVEADMRFTNYYMDLQVNSSPVEVAIQKAVNKAEKAFDDVTNCQLFIDGLTVYGHRLFGAPPNEPTYVCNWDFDIGYILGECSSDFLRIVLAAVQAFIFTMDDDENALPHIESVLPDITFLRCRTRGLRVWLVVDETAFLIELAPTQVSLNDWSNAHFSKEVRVSVPTMVAAAVETRAAYRQRDQAEQMVPTLACIKTSCKLAVLNKRADFAHYRMLQQQHLRYHDQRTHRADWLLHEHTSKLHNEKEVGWSRQPPAMPVPDLPEPLSVELQDHRSGATKGTTTSASPTSKRNVLSKTEINQKRTDQPEPQSYQRATFVSPAQSSRNHSVADAANVAPTNVSTSTPWSAPLFPLQRVQPDLTFMPNDPNLGNDLKNATQDEFDEEYDYRNEEVKHDGVFCELADGIRGFCTPQLFTAIAKLVDDVLPKNPESILDAIQMKTISNIKGLVLQTVSQIDDLAVRFPFAHLRLLNFQSTGEANRGFDQHNIEIDRTKLSLRLTPQNFKTVAASGRAMHVLAYATVNSIVVNISESLLHRTSHYSHGTLVVRDAGIWLSLQDSDRARVQLNSFEFETTGRNIDSLAALIQRTGSMAAGIVADLDSLDQSKHIRHTIYHLTAEEGASDPAFLSRPSYVLRTASSHVRLDDSWKILSRLRTTWLSLSSSVRSSSGCDISCNAKADSHDSEKHIRAAIGQLRSWEGAHAADSPLVVAIFGPAKAVAEYRTREVDSELEMLLGQASIVLDPGPRQSAFVLQSLDLNFSDKPVLKNNSSTKRPPAPKQRKTIQSYSGNFAVHLNWELLELAESLFDKIPSPPTATATATGDKLGTMDDAPMTGSQNDFMFILGTDRASVQIEAINLRVLLAAEKLKSSVVLSQNETKLSNSAIFLTSVSAKMRFDSKSTTLMAWRLSNPSVYAAYQQEHNNSQQLETVRLAASSQRLRFSLRGNILECLEVSRAVIQEEAVAIQSLVSSIEKRRSQTTLYSRRNHEPANFHVALLLTNYRLDFALTPALHYTIHGNVARTSVVPHPSSRFVVNVDLAETHHALDNPKAASHSTVSTFAMPSVNGKAIIDITPDRIRINAHTTVEMIALEASAVRSSIEVVYRPETVEYFKGVKREVGSLQRVVQDSFTREEAAEKSNVRSPQTLQVFQYTGQAALAGVKIHCVAPVTRGGHSYKADLKLSVGHISLNLHNKQTDSDALFKQPQFDMRIRHISLDLARHHKLRDNFGHFSMDLRVLGTAELHEDSEEVQNYKFLTTGIRLDLHEETATLVADISAFLQKRLKELPKIDEAKVLRPLRRLTLSAPYNKHLEVRGQSEEPEAVRSTLLDSVYTLDVTAVRVRWILNDQTPLSPGRALEDMVFSIARVDLSTKREGSARLAISNMQLQTSPQSSANPVERSANSALLPDMVFNAAYVSGKSDRRLAFKAAGKAVDIRLAADFVVPASALQKSLARASIDLRKLQPATQGNTEPSQTPLPRFLGNKRLASLLVYADFAGAVITITPRKEDHPTSAFGLLKGAKRSRAGRYGQAVQSGSGEEATLRAPGIALQVEYRDTGEGDPALSTELKVAGSSNTLAPSVVPLLRELSSSVTDVMGQGGSTEKAQSPKPKQSSKENAPENVISAADPAAILGRVKLNAGLWIQKQEFSLTCQPIARVSATAKFDEIFLTVNTVQAAEQDRFFSVVTTFRGLSVSVQHVYSRESTASFEVESIVISLMNSKHFSDRSGISAILNVSPMQAELNAKQMQDFLLFREIWYPAELRRAPKTPAPAANASTSQLNAIQRYQEISATAAVPWHAIVSVQEVKLQVDFGQSLGKSNFTISKLWVSSKKASDSEQNLCVGFDKVGINSAGRMSGFVELQGFRVRTAIKFPRIDAVAQAPLVQGSVGFEHLRSKVAFDYQPFAVADISSFDFLMYNVRNHGYRASDRLVGILDGGKIQMFCTAAAAAQMLSIYQAFERLIQEKQDAYQSSLRELDKFLRRKSVFPSVGSGSLTVVATNESSATKPSTPLNTSTSLQTDVVITLRAIDIGAFPNTFFDQQILKVEAVDVSTRFAVGEAEYKTHSGLGMSLGQVRVALSSVNKPAAKALGEVSVADVIEKATSSRGGTILKVPRLVASMQTWQKAQSNVIEYIFKSTFQGKVDVGWNYSRISFIRGMWDVHSRALAHRLGKPLAPSAVKITAEPQGNGPEGSGQEKITAVVNVPQSKYDYVPLEPPIIDTPQLRDLGEATPSLEWIGLHREKLPNVTHSVIIVTLLELVKEVEDSYGRILGLG